MGIGKRLKEAREAAGLTQEELGKLVGVTGSAITNYEKETSHPKETVMYALFNALQVEPNYLFQDCVHIIKFPDSTHTATLAEMERIKKYRSLDDRGKRIVDTVLDHEAERVGEIRDLMTYQRDNVIPLPRSIQKTSAGRGAYLGPEDMETIWVEENDLTRRASFCVPVTGDSMEPTYHDGDILLVEGRDDIDPGQIGVFTVDGDGYVKKRGEGELISLNPDYAPIPLTENSWCNGLVIGVLDPAWLKEG